MFQVGDIVSYQDHLARVMFVDSQNKFISTSFINESSWEWWFGDSYENIVNDYGTDLAATFEYDELELVQPLGPAKTWEDML
jgi:hypothetical protein